MGKFWSGLGKPKAQRSPLLHRSRQSHSLLPPTINLLRAHHHPRHHTYLKLNVGNSPSCSVIWSILPNVLRSSTLKSTGMWCVHIRRSALKSSPALMDISHNSLGMDSWCTLATLSPMRMTPKEQYARVWEFLLRWGTSILVCNKRKAFN